VSYPSALDKFEAVSALVNTLTAEMTQLEEEWKKLCEEANAVKSEEVELMEGGERLAERVGSGALVQVFRYNRTLPLHW